RVGPAGPARRAVGQPPRRPPGAARAARRLRPLRASPHARAAEALQRHGCGLPPRRRGGAASRRAPRERGHVMFAIEKPLPAITEDGAPWWDGCRQGELRAQRCGACGHLRWPPSVLCPACLAEGGEWVRLSGRGTVWSFIVVHRPQHPAFFGDVPYNVAVVELEEGPRLHANVVECANE